MPKIDSFINKLSSRPSANAVENQYSCPAKADNLECYLRQIIKVEHTLFVGEAPGHLGAAKTGIGFTSPFQLQQGTHPFIDSILGGLSVGTASIKESTAKCFWESMKNHNINPVPWNVFPFHPHKEGDPNSNRTPNKREISEGIDYLHKLLKIIKPQKIFSVGRFADNLLNELKIEHLHVRHPSYGGQTKFKNQIKDFYK